LQTEKKIILISEGARNFNSADYSFVCNRFGFLNAMHKKKKKFKVKFLHACTKNLSLQKSGHYDVISDIVS